MIDILLVCKANIIHIFCAAFIIVTFIMQDKNCYQVELVIFFKLFHIIHFLLSPGEKVEEGIRFRAKNI